MATQRTRSVTLLHVTWAMIVMLPYSVVSLSDHCSVSKILDCEETHQYVFQSGSMYQKKMNCFFSFSTSNRCNMAITVRDVNMAPPDANGECTTDRLQVYDLKNQVLQPGNTYCGSGSGTNATAENQMSSNVGLVVFQSYETVTPRSFLLGVKTSVVEAPGTELPPGTEGSEPPGSAGPVGNSTTVAPGGSGNSTEPAPGGFENTTRRPSGAGNGTVTRPPVVGGGGNATGTGTTGEGGNGTLSTPPTRG